MRLPGLWTLGFLALVLVEVCTLAVFAVAYMALRGWMLTLAVIILFSSIAYAALAMGFKILFNNLHLGKASLPAGLLAASSIYTAMLYAIVWRYWEPLLHWETLSALLESSNIYGYLSLMGLGETTIALYSIVSLEAQHLYLSSS